jgi:hypothetical protein
MPFAGSEQAKRAAAAKRARDVHLVTTHAHDVVFAAYRRGVFSPSLAASLVAGGARADLGHPSAGPAPDDLPWLNDLMRVGPAFFAAVTAYALEKKVGAEIDGEGFAYVRGASLPGTVVANFVEVMRKPAPTSRDAAGASSVDGRVKKVVPGAFQLRGILAEVARALRPGMFPDAVEDGDFEISFIYLTLLEDSKTQDWHRDYIKYLRSIVFLIFLDDGIGSTEFKHGDGVHVSTAVTGDILAFDPTCEHRGVATGKLPRHVRVVPLQGLAQGGGARGQEVPGGLHNV